MSSVASIEIQRDKPADKREGMRMVVDLEVLIYRYGYAVAAGRVSNVAPGGAFVTTDYRASPGTVYLDLGFVSRDRDVTREYRVKGRIVHRSPGGLGFMIQGGSQTTGFPPWLA